MSNKGVKFIDNIGQHEYRSRLTDKVYLSCTRFVGIFKHTFDRPFWLFYKAVQYKLGIPDARKKEFSRLCWKYGMDWNSLSYEPLIRICAENRIDVESLINEDVKNVDLLWDALKEAGCVKGSRYHDFKERSEYEKGKSTKNEGSMDSVDIPVNYKYSFDLSELEDGAHLELIVYNDAFEVCGAIDKVFIETDVFGTRWFDIDDYKTYKNPVQTTGFRKMKEPISHLDDCNFISAALQTNFYAWMLIQQGYKMRSLRFTHHRVNDDGNLIGVPIPYIVPNFQYEIDLMLRHHFKKDYETRKNS